MGLTSGGSERPMALTEEQTELPLQDDSGFEAIAQRAGEHNSEEGANEEVPSEEMEITAEE